MLSPSCAASAAVIDAPVTVTPPAAASHKASASIVPIDDETPLSSMTIRIQLPDGSPGGSDKGGLSSVRVRTYPTGSPISSPLAADMSEEQLQHIASLVRKSKKSRRRHKHRHPPLTHGHGQRYGHAGDLSAPPNSVVSTPSSAAGVLSGPPKSLQCPPSARGAGAGGVPSPISTTSTQSSSSRSSGLLSASSGSALSSVRSLTVPFTSPGSGCGSGSSAASAGGSTRDAASRSPLQYPSLAFSSSPRNVNVFKLKLPSSGQASSPNAHAVECPSSSTAHRTRVAEGVTASPPSVALHGSPLGSDGGVSESCSDDEDDDFTALATPGNAGLGAEEDGEIILCGLHVVGGQNGRGGPQRQNSSGTLAPCSSSGGDTSESDVSDGNTPTEGFDETTLVLPFNIVEGVSITSIAADTDVVHQAENVPVPADDVSAAAAIAADVPADPPPLAPPSPIASVGPTSILHGVSLRPCVMRTMSIPLNFVPSAALASPCAHVAHTPTFSNAFDTTMIDHQQQRQQPPPSTPALPVLHASAAQQVAEKLAHTPPQYFTPQLCAAPPSTGVEPPAHDLGESAMPAINSARSTSRKLSRRATLSGAECGMALNHVASSAASAAAAASSSSSSSRGKSHRQAPYDFSPAGHLIIDGFEISKRGVARTPEVQTRRLSLSTTSCGNSPMFSARSVFGALHNVSSPASAAASSYTTIQTPTAAPTLTLSTSMESPATGYATPSAPLSATSISGTGMPMAPRRLTPLGPACPPNPVLSAAGPSEPPSLTNTPTLVGRRLSLVKLQREKSKVEEAAQAAQALLTSTASALTPTARPTRSSWFQRRRCESVDISPVNSMAGLGRSSSFSTGGLGVGNVGGSGMNSEPVSAATPLDPLVPSEAELRASFGPGFRAPKAASLGIELRLSDLVRLGEIGRGVNGAVYKAVYLPTLRIVALKSVSIFDKDERHQFLQELHAFLHCASEHMVKFVGACFSEGLITMALDYLNRGSLDHVVAKSGPLSEPVLRLVVQQLLLGVRDLHAQGFLHRDIKPANFLCSNTGVSVISDFGLLKRLETDAQTGGVKECSKFVGTMLYLAPERIAGQPFSFPSDIYAVGLSVIFLATGALTEVPRDYWALVAASSCSSSAPPSLPAEGNFSPALRDFVSKMMLKDPAARWTAEQLLQHHWFAEGEAQAAADVASDPLESWPGREPTEPNTDELTILVDAVVHRWYPMPTQESIHAAEGFPPPIFQPSIFDHARFAHLAQQLGWKEATVTNAFVKRIREKTATTLATLGVTIAQAQVSAPADDVSDSSTFSIISGSSSASVSLDSSACSSTSSTAPSSVLSSAMPSAFSSFSLPHSGVGVPSSSGGGHASMPFTLPLHNGSPRAGITVRGYSGGASAHAPSRSSTSLPLPGTPMAAVTTGVAGMPQCLSPTTANKPPKAPVRSHSPVERMAELVLPPVASSVNSSAASAGAAAVAGAIGSIPSGEQLGESRLASRRLSASGRRLSFQMRRGDALAQTSCATTPGTAGLTPSAPGSQPMSGASSPRGSGGALAPPRSLGLSGAAEALAAAIAALPRTNRAGSDASPRTAIGQLTAASFAGNSGTEGAAAAIPAATTAVPNATAPIQPAP